MVSESDHSDPNWTHHAHTEQLSRPKVTEQMSVYLQTAGTYNNQCSPILKQMILKKLNGLMNREWWKKKKKKNFVQFCCWVLQQVVMSSFGRCTGTERGRESILCIEEHEPIDLCVNKYIFLFSSFKWYINKLRKQKDKLNILYRPSKHLRHWP